MKRIFVSMALVLMILAGVAQAQTSDRAGSTGALFLKLGMSPRAAAMGNTYMGISDDITGVFLNPVSIVGLEDYQFFVSELEYMIDMRAFAGAFSFPLGGDIGGRAAVHYTGFFSGDMDKTTETQINGTGETFSWNELAIGATYARSFTDKFAIGCGVKYVRTDVADFYSQTVAFDIGTLYKTGYRNLTIGMSATNFGPDMKFNGKYDNTYIQSIWQVSTAEDFGYYPLPISFQVGVADELYTADEFSFTGAIDYSHPNDLAERIHVGGEFEYDDMLFLRGGIFMDMDQSDLEDPIAPGDDSLDRFMEYRFGVGFSYANVVVDYAWQDIENLEGVHRIALSVKL